MSKSNKLEGAIDQSQKLKKKLEAFSDILDDLASTEDKKKLLWKEVYENALIDRENAGMLFTDAWSRMGTGSTEHVTLGSTLTKYLERMSKSNEQILRLVELISKAEERENRVEPEDIFGTISDD